MVREGAGKGEQQSLNREELLQLGIQTARAGNKQSARVIFQQVLNGDPRNERALLWMASLARDSTDKRRYLTRVLRYNPNNETARRELQRMARQEKARTNRTLIYGGLAVGGIVLLIFLVILILVLLSQVGF